MKLNISPTPWRPWEGGPSHVIVAADESNVAILSNAGTDYAMPLDPAVREANSHLMAAAPDLLAVLESFGVLACTPEWQAKKFAAIEKAKGRTS